MNLARFLVELGKPWIQNVVGKGVNGAVMLNAFCPEGYRAGPATSTGTGPPAYPVTVGLCLFFCSKSEHSDRGCQSRELYEVLQKHIPRRP